MSLAPTSRLRRKPLIALEADHKRIIWLLRTMGAVPRIQPCALDRGGSAWNARYR